jgi:hypothetical protein
MGKPKVTVKSTAKPRVKARHTGGKATPAAKTATNYKGKRFKNGAGSGDGDSDMWLNMGMRGR